MKSLHFVAAAAGGAVAAPQILQPSSSSVSSTSTTVTLPGVTSTLAYPADQEVYITSGRHGPPTVKTRKTSSTHKTATMYPWMFNSSSSSLSETVSEISSSSKTTKDYWKTKKGSRSSQTGTSGSNSTTHTPHSLPTSTETCTISYGSISCSYATPTPAPETTFTSHKHTHSVESSPPTKHNSSEPVPIYSAPPKTHTPPMHTPPVYHNSTEPMTTPPPQTGGYTSTLPSSSAPVYPNSTQPTTIESYPVTSYPIETKTHGYPVTTEYCITINGKAYTLLPSESPKPPSPTISYPDFQPLPKTYQPPYGEPPKSGSTPTSPPPIELPPAVELPPGVELPPAVMLPPAVQLPPGERPPPAVELPPGVELPPAVELPPKMEAPSQPPSYVEHPPQGSSEPPSYSPLPKTYQPPNSPPIVELPPAIELPPKMEAPSPPPYVEAPPKQIQASPPPYHAPSPPKETHPAPPPPKETCSTPSAPPVQPPVQPPAPPPANNYSVSIFIPTTNSSPSPTPSSIEYTSPVEHLYPSQTAPSIPVSYAPSQAPPSPAESPKPNPSGVCPLDLPPTFEFPHYMVPVDTSKPEYTSPNSYHGYVSPTSTTILTFDIPPSLSGRTCHAYFALPKHGQMETSEFTLSGSGSFEFAELAGPALAHGLKPADIPATERHLGSWTPTEGSVHEVASGMCNAGGRVTFSMASKGLNFSWFQDYNPCPIGLYIIPE